MVFFQWRLYLKAAQACYQFALKFLPGATFIIGTETAREPEFSCEDMNDDEIYATPIENQIPAAPTDEVSLNIFLDGTRASLDAAFQCGQELHDEPRIMTKDDAYFDMLNSLKESLIDKINSTQLTKNYIKGVPISRNSLHNVLWLLTAHSLREQA